jgi:hypothetical protein
MILFLQQESFHFLSENAKKSHLDFPAVAAAVLEKKSARPGGAGRTDAG